MSSNDLIVNQQAFKNRVSEYVQNVFGSLIPPEQFKKLVDDEIKAFFNEPTAYTWETTAPRSYGVSSGETLNIKITPFRQMVWGLVKTHVLQELNKWLAGEQEQNFKNFAKELIESDTLKEGSLVSTQKLMMLMAGHMFYNCATQANMQVRADLANIFGRHGLTQVYAELTTLNTNFSDYLNSLQPMQGPTPVQGVVTVRPNSGA